MTILPIEDQNKIVEVMEHILNQRRTQETVSDIMKLFRLTYAEYNMIENLTIPAFKQCNEAEAFRAKYGILKSRLMNAKQKWQHEVFKQEMKGDDKA